MMISSSAGILGFTARGAFGSSWMCFIAIAMGDSPRNGRAPENIS